MDNSRSYSGKIIYLKIGDDYADGLIGGKGFQFVYFLCQNVYDEELVQTNKSSALRNLELHLSVNFEATVVDAKRGFLVAEIVWLKKKPRNIEPVAKIYSIERVIDLYGQYKADLGTSRKDIQKNSYIIWNSLFDLFGTPLASQGQHLRGKTAKVWRTINEDEGLLLLGGSNGQTGSLVWFNRSHLLFTSFKKEDTFDRLFDEIFHFDADLIWEAANGYSWYEATTMWQGGDFQFVEVDDRIGTPLSDYRSESVFTEQLKLGQMMVRAGTHATIVDRFFWTLSQHEAITRNRKIEAYEGSDEENGETSDESDDENKTFGDSAMSSEKLSETWSFLPTPDPAEQEALDSSPQDMTYFNGKSSKLAEEDVEDKIVGQSSEQKVMDYVRSLDSRKKGQSLVAEKFTQTVSTGNVIHLQVYTGTEGS